jgi:hypothetical protein
VITINAVLLIITQLHRDIFRSRLLTTTQAEHKVQRALLLDVIVAQGATVLQLLTSKDETLLVRRNAFLVLNLRLDVVNRVARLNLQGDGLASEGLDENLHTTTQTKNEVKGALLLDVVVAQSSAVLKLLASENKTLLVRGDALLVLNLRLHIIDRVRRLDFQSDSLSSEGLDEDLHTTTKAEDEMEGGLLLNVVVGERATILKLLSGENEALLVRRNALLVLNLRLNIVDGIGGLHLEGDGLSSEGLDEDLHATTEAEDEVKGGLLLDVVIR